MKIITIFLTLIAVGLITFITLTLIDSNNEVTETETNAQQQISTPNESSENNKTLRKNRQTAIDFESKVEDPSEEVESKVNDMIHRMTHEKVRAESKWGHLKITDERIDEVISLLEQYNVDNRTFLHEEMLDWKDGDFSNSVKIHNVLTQPSDERYVRPGKAYGLLSAQEQKDFKERYEENDDVPQEEYEGYQEMQETIKQYSNP